MTTPHWVTIDLLTDRLEREGAVSKSDIKDLRSAAYQLELWFTTLQELREECEAARIKRHEQDEALQALSDVFFRAAKFAMQEITMDAFATGVRDKASFKNIMATVYGLDDVGTPLPPKKCKRDYLVQSELRA
jgi:phosphopantetheinyl transferase (holo-ACP synthase)